MTDFYSYANRLLYVPHSGTGWLLCRALFVAMLAMRRMKEGTDVPPR